MNARSLTDFLPLADMLEVADVGVEVPGRSLLQTASAQFIAGQVTAVLGPNGAGKSTLMSLLTGQWRFSKTLRLNAGLINLTNKKYWNWSDVRGVAANSSFRDAYSQPGRYFNVSLVADF